MDLEDLPSYYAPLIPALPDLPAWLDEHCEKFLRFTVPYTDGSEDGPVRIKVEHSLLVLAHTRALVEDEARQGGDPLEGRAALLAALYHDCGRFPQFRRYHTFQDAASFNHGRLGLRVLRQNFLARERREVQHLVRTAVLLHNRYSLPARLRRDAARITLMVRDADKLDIMRVMALHLNAALPGKDSVVLGVKDEPERYSEPILRQVLEGAVPSYADLRYVNDFRLLLGAWPREMRFAATGRALVQSGYLESILRDLPDTPKMREARQRIFASLARLAEGYGKNSA